MIESSRSVVVRIKGQWVAVPVMEVNGDKLIARGKWLKIAQVCSEEMMEKELKDPEIYLAALKNDTDQILKADIFSFTQKLPTTRPKYGYTMEWESVAAISLASFREWWEGLPQETPEECEALPKTRRSDKDQRV